MTDEQWYEWCAATVWNDHVARKGAGYQQHAEWKVDTTKRFGSYRDAPLKQDYGVDVPRAQWKLMNKHEGGNLARVKGVTDIGAMLRMRKMHPEHRIDLLLSLTLEEIQAEELPF